MTAIPKVPDNIKRLGLIAGSGRLPQVVLQEAAQRGIPVTVAAIAEEAESEIEPTAAESGPEVTIHWIGLGQLGRMIKIFKAEGVDRVLMIGQVKHVRIFAPGSKSPFKQLKHLPDLKMMKMLASLNRCDTGSLLGAVVQTIEAEGFEVLDSRVLLTSLLPARGILTKREPSREEIRDFEYGREVARELTRLDLGQTLVVKNQAVVAVEAMEGTDETIRRASRLVAGEPLSVVKSSRSSRETRFDVPVLGMRTLDVFRECHVTALAVDAGQTLILEQDRFLEKAGRMGITIVGY